MAPRRPTRQQQTRLNFEPAPAAVQKSEAFVRIDPGFSPTKKRKTGKGTSNDHDPSGIASIFNRSQPRVVLRSPRGKPEQLPTPAPSSQIDNRQERVDGDDEEGFVTAESQSSRTRNAEKNESSDEEDAVPRSTGRRQRNAVALSSESDASEPITPYSRRSRNNALATPSTPTERTSPPRPRSAKSFILGGAQGTAAFRERKSPWKSASPTKSRRTSGDSRASKDSESAFECHMPADNSPKRSLRSAAKSLPKPHTRRQLDFGLGFAVPEDSSDDAAVNGRSSRTKPNATSRKLSKPERVQLEIQESSESADNVSPAEARGKKERPGLSQPNHQDDLEIEGELADLQDTETRKTRTRGKPQATERNKRLSKLEELRRRRAGIVEISDDESLGESADEDEETALNDALVDADEDLDEYEADFIDEGEDGTIGVDLAKSGVPLAFTGFANLKPFEYFKHEVEWMIHNKLDPAFERHDEVYELSHKKLDDEVKGHADSTFISAVWRQEFASALMSRPDFSRVEIPAMFERICDACNRSNHPPKHQVILKGHKYDPNSLDKIGNDESDDESNEGSDDNEPQEVFFLGRFCCANAEIAHMLYHWRYQLNETILEWLSMEGHTSPEKVVARENWNRKRREKLANKVVDGMVESGEMKDLYRQFKQNLEAARSAKPARFSNN